jgi:uncharacterized protein YdaU (DUF1376 family)
MSVTAKGIYRELLDLQWEDSGVPLTEDDARAIIHATEEEWAHFSPYFSQCFPDGKNEKLAELRESAVAARNKQIESGTKGGNIAGKGRAKDKPRVPKAKLRGTPNQTETETETETVKLNTPKSPEGDTDYAKQNPFDGWKNLEGFKDLKEAWAKYQVHRKELKVKAYTETGLRQLVSRIENVSPPGKCCRVLVAAIERTLLGSWSGIPDGVIVAEAQKLGNAPKQEYVEVNYWDPDRPMVMGVDYRTLGGVNYEMKRKVVFDEDAHRAMLRRGEGVGV